MHATHPFFCGHVNMMTMDHRQLKSWLEPCFASDALLFEAWWTHKIEPEIARREMTMQDWDTCRCWILQSWIDDHVQRLMPSADASTTEDSTWINNVMSIHMEDYLPNLDAVVHCQKCNNTTMIDQHVRDTRSADEGATVHFTCRSCRHTWTMR